uniref:Dystroglycan-type cadherin-like domain-containing protein n=1 Tax=Candidatus Kentrum sp. DK TaxID=2126562 RepID=A0A450T998_9GAMM|nr:MAG: hypothetical protein BECKDK2373B_GA0170837_11234 [Candidatus Kentron sp. DK]
MIQRRQNAASSYWEQLSLEPRIMFDASAAESAEGNGESTAENKPTKYLSLFGNAFVPDFKSGPNYAMVHKHHVAIEVGYDSGEKIGKHYYSRLNTPFMENETVDEDGNPFYRPYVDESSSYGVAYPRFHQLDYSGGSLLFFAETADGHEELVFDENDYFYQESLKHYLITLVSDDSGAEDTVSVTRENNPAADINGDGFVETVYFYSKQDPLDPSSNITQKKVGTINEINNGRNGRPLQIDLIQAESFYNGGFESEPFNIIANLQESGWILPTTDEEGKIESGAGVVTVLDGALPEPNENYMLPVESYREELPSGVSLADNKAHLAADMAITIDSHHKTEGDYSLALLSDNLVVEKTGELIHGPYIVTSELFLSESDLIHFDWVSFSHNEGDSSEAFVYLVDVTEGRDPNDRNNQVLLHEFSDLSDKHPEHLGLPWKSVDESVSKEGYYRLVFLSGTVDYTVGSAAGSSFYIDNLTTKGTEVIGGNVLTEIAEQILIGNDSDDLWPAGFMGLHTTAAPDDSAPTEDYYAWFSVQVTNDAPVITINGKPNDTDPVSYAQSMSNEWKRIGTGISITDIDDINLASAEISITKNFNGNIDELGFEGREYDAANDIWTFDGNDNIQGSYDAVNNTWTFNNGITSSYDGTNGTLTLEATEGAPLTAFRDTLRQVSYRTDLSDPGHSTDNREITFTITDTNTDGYGGDVIPWNMQMGWSPDNNYALSASVTRAILLDRSNSEPELRGIGDTVYTEGDAPLPIARALVLEDAEDPDTIVKATVSIGEGFQAEEDELGLAGQYDEISKKWIIDKTVIDADADIIGSYDEAKGEWTFGNITVAYDQSGENRKLIMLTEAGEAASETEFQNLLRSVTYRNISEHPTQSPSRTIEFSVTDGNAAGTGGTNPGPLTGFENCTIEVMPVNDPITIPVFPNTEPNSPIEGMEDHPLILRSQEGSDWIEIEDPDAGEQYVTVTLQIEAGDARMEGSTLTLLDSLEPLDETKFSLLDFGLGIGDGRKDSQMTFTGKLSVVNEVLDGGIIFSPPENAYGTASIQIHVSDLGNSGPAGAPSETTAEEIIYVNILPVNDAPRLIIRGSPLEYAEVMANANLENGEVLLLFSDPENATLTLSDDDDDYIVSATIEITDGFRNGEDRLELIGPLPDTIEATHSENGKKWELQSKDPNGAPIDDFQTALRSASYRNLSEDGPTGGDRVITFSPTDGNSNGDADGPLKGIGILTINMGDVPSSSHGSGPTDNGISGDSGSGESSTPDSNEPSVTVINPSDDSLDTPIPLASLDSHPSGFTQGGDENYPVLVSDSPIISSMVSMAPRGAERAPDAIVCDGPDGDRLALNREIEDVMILIGKNFEFSIPYDVFIHTNPDAEIQLQAKRIDGVPFPDWLRFYPETGTFTGVVPPVWTKETIVVELIARDARSGCEVSTSFNFCTVNDKMQECQSEQAEEWDEKWDEQWENENSGGNGIPHTDGKLPIQSTVLPEALEQRVCRSAFSTQLSMAGRTGFETRQAAFAALIDGQGFSSHFL